MPDSSINVLAELERVGASFEFAGENEVKCICPFHADTSPSCSINIEKRVFKCQTASCGKKGDFVTYLARVLNTTRVVVLADLSTRYTIETVKTISPDTVERYHKRIDRAGPLLKALRDRGVSKTDIRKYRLGEVDGRITIPIKNGAGAFVNVRKYLPGAPGREKMRNARGHGKLRLFPVDQLSYDSVLLCGGEVKAIVAAAKLNRHGIGAISTTGGESAWDIEFSRQFQGKTVYVCMDIDAAGKKASQEHCQRLSRVAGWVGKVELPLDPDRYPTGDINDYVATENGSLKALINKCQEWLPSSRVPESVSDATKCSLEKATSARFAGKRVRVSAIVSAVQEAPYLVPKTVTVECAQEGRSCMFCPAFANEEPFHIHPESAAVLEIVGAQKGTQREAIMSALGIPLACRTCDFVASEYYRVEDARISPRLEITNRTSDRIMQPAICVSSKIELNESYHLEGRLHPHPKTQQATLLISSSEPTQDALSTYECGDLSKLDCFTPTAWTVEAIDKKLAEIYEDLEANVTRIYQRRDLHLTVDLTYHSPLLLTFDGRTVKGWSETLVLGDSAQGKSETALNLQKHYGLGEKVECKNASVAGLLGGLQQHGNKWFVSWGVIPTHDKRLVILEELKGASTEVFAKLTDMRSSGVAEIPKIEKRRTQARTRLLALSNPRGDKQLSAYNFGIEAVKELVGGLEDVRRFDFALLVSSGEIDSAELNKLQKARPTVAHKYTGGLCRSLILWAWTRAAKEVAFSEAASVAVLKHATQLSEEFTDAIPLIDRGSTRFKVARLAAALAGRTFSHGDTFDTLLVRTCHVEYIARMVRRVYSGSIFGYKDYTQAIAITQTLLDPDAIRKRINETPYPKDFCEQVLHTQKMDVQDLQDWNGWERQEAMHLLSFMVRKHALRRDGRAYRKTSRFIVLLKDLLEGGGLAERPDFIPDVEEF
jgi:hypothetical protein